MRLKRKPSRRERSGAMLIIAMMFVVVFSALAVCMATLSGNNVQLASNHQNINAALAAAQSGQEVVRYLVSRVLIPSSTPQDQYFNEIITAVRNDMTTNGIAVVRTQRDGPLAGLIVHIDSGDGSLKARGCEYPRSLSLLGLRHGTDVQHNLKVQQSNRGRLCVLHAASVHSRRADPMICGYIPGLDFVHPHRQFQKHGLIR